ncbi:hypothetical protein EK21DRAFT_87467 [Setomelanomma holmii]|uniref:Uncharacterized protein n=1 Tax=Setomelanomma holmii TaxID=210430 RepID=A0A9P4LPV1_9PLEO|nr:hypothetical protein EK21DRAFT_87467 [Setomelanomma holmii]
MSDILFLFLGVVVVRVYKDACVAPSRREYGDSSLSVASNILSIITFVCVAGLGTLYAITRQWSSKGDVARLRPAVSVLRPRLETVKEPIGVVAFFTAMRNSALPNSAVEGCINMTDHRLSEIEEEMAKLPDHADGSGDRWLFVWRNVASIRKVRIWDKDVRSLKDMISQVEQVRAYAVRQIEAGQARSTRDNYDVTNGEDPASNSAQQGMKEKDQS